MSVDYPFSDLYTHCATVTGLPRKQVKEAIIKMFYGMEPNEDFKLIQKAFQERLSNATTNPEENEE